MNKKIKYIKKFFQNEIWAIDLDKVSKFKKAYIRLAQILTLGVKSFNEDKLNIRASALTYFTVLSIVPVIALGFGIAKGFNLDEDFEREISNNLAGQQEVLGYILKFTHSMLDTAKGGLIAGFGLALLLWSVVKLLNNIENSFNTVWDVKKPRSFVRKLTDYLAIMLIAPIFMILSSSISIYISTTLSHISEDGGLILSYTTPLFLKFAKIIPYILVWGLFTIIYIIMPNVKVNFKSALIAGIIAGSIFQAFQGLYVFFQSGATRINTIYGSFAALPLFLIWMQISWFVVLLGAEISYAVQNVKLKGSEINLNNLSLKYQKKIAVALVKNIVDYFEKGDKAPSSQILSAKLKIPVSTVSFVLNNLVKASVISLIKKDNKHSYQPAKSTNILKISDVTEGYENIGTDNSKFISDKTFKNLETYLSDISKESEKSNKNFLLKDIV